MDKLRYIVPGGTSIDPAKVGGKAASLAELSGKFMIPQWFVVSPEAFMSCLSDIQIQKIITGEPIGEILFDKIVQEEIMTATKQLANSGQLLAIRSSASTEDGKNASFAGQLESFLNVPPAQILNKVHAVWHSAFSSHVMHYRKTFTDSAEWIPAVIVQHMVKADTAGVAFSSDPVTGDQSKCVINATSGLADKLLSGEINGDTYHTSKCGKIEKQNSCGKNPILTQETVSKIVKLLGRVEEHFGLPQDIEWAKEGENIYLLQARPITSLNHVSKVGSQITLWDNSNIVESYSGVTSPLTFSFACNVYQHVYVEFCKLMGVGASKIEQENNAFCNMLGFVNGHVYYNMLNWYRVLALFPGFKINRKFMEQMMGVKESLPEDIIKNIIPDRPSLWSKVTDSGRFIRTLWGLIWHQVKLSKTIQRFYKRLNESLSSHVILENLSLDQLSNEYRKLERKLLKKWDAPLINDFLCMIAFGLSRRLLEKFAGEEGLKLHNDIMIGQGDIVSAEPAILIRKMAEIARRDYRIVDRLVEGDSEAISNIPELKKEYEGYLKKFGDRCLQELKLESLTLHNNPTTLLQAIGHMARREKQTKKLIEHSNVNAQLQHLFRNKPLKRWVVTQVVKWAKARVRDRENLRFERTRIFARVRNIFIEIGKRFHELEYIRDSRDIFLLEVPEVIGLIEGTATVMDIDKLIKIRSTQQEKFKSQPAPPKRFKTYGAFYSAFRSQAYHTDIHSEILNADHVKGIGCCQGIVRATVRVITDPRNAELKPGEIMVAEFTDPGWITLFANAAGILVERGSLLSHSAIVAREMGIPAIVAIDGIMKWLESGDTVEMNGATGIIRKIEKKGWNDGQK